MLNVATVHPSPSEYFIRTLQKRFDPTLSSYITLKRRYMPVESPLGTNPCQADLRCLQPSLPWPGGLVCFFANEGSVTFWERFGLSAGHERRCFPES